MEYTVMPLVDNAKEVDPVTKNPGNAIADVSSHILKTYVKVLVIICKRFSHHCSLSIDNTSLNK